MYHYRESILKVTKKSQKNILSLILLFFMSSLATYAMTEDLPATLAFDGHQFSANGNQISLNINIKNIGDETAQRVEVFFRMPAGIQAIGKKQFIVNEIKAGSSYKTTLKFTVNSTNPNSEYAIQCFVKEGKTQKEIRETFKYKKKSNRGNSNTELIWISPDPDMLGNSIVSDKGVYDIKLKAISNNKLKAQNFTVYINNTSLDGSKFEEGELRTAPSGNNTSRLRHTYSGKIVLQKGVNKVFVEVLNDDGTTRTIPIEINYNPQRANLHVLAIGPKHKDLQYTGKDAMDFAAAFNNQEDRLFKKVFVHTLTEKDKTNKTSIERAFMDLQHNFDNEEAEEKIKPSDMVIVFISSHGKKVGKSFKILSSSYEFRYPTLETIDYEEHILGVLDNLDCKKLIFIDACNSGSAKDWGRKSIADDEMSKALHTLINAKEGLSTITSCQKDELSYEHEIWQNGAFTEAILAAFSNKRFVKNGKTYIADTDGNRIITLGELKNYLLAYVPHLVKTQRPDAITSQKPHIAANDLDIDIPVYALDSYVHQEVYIPNKNRTSNSLIVSNNNNSTYPSSTPNYSNQTTTNPAAMDSDGDGVTDNMDGCPEEYGLLSNNGCPKASARKTTGALAGQLTHQLDNKSYQWRRMKDGRNWMIENLNLEIKGKSWVYGQKGKKSKNRNNINGRLYTWNAAQKACPNGWRLPTKGEWNQLIKSYGGEKTAYESLMQGGGSGFSANLAGFRESDNNYCCENSFGRFWSKDNDISNGFSFDFNGLNNTVELDSVDKNKGLSCRCIEDN